MSDYWTMESRVRLQSGFAASKEKEFFARLISPTNGCSLMEAVAPRGTDDTTEELGCDEEAHRRWPERRSERGASKAKVVPPFWIDQTSRAFYSIPLSRRSQSASTIPIILFIPDEFRIPKKRVHAIRTLLISMLSQQSRGIQHKGHANSSERS